MVQQKYAKKGWYCCCHFVICWCWCWWSSSKIKFFMPIRNPRWPPSQDRLTLSPMGKMFKCETKLYLIVHWIVLYRDGSNFSHKIPQKCSRLPPLGAIFLSAPSLTWNPGSAPALQSLTFLFNMEFKMAATAWLGLTSDPMGKMF